MEVATLITFVPRTDSLLLIESEAAIRAFYGQTLAIKTSERTAHVTRKRHFNRSSAITLPVLREVNLSMYLYFHKQKREGGLCI